MISLAINIRCKELKYLIKSCKKVVNAKGFIRRFIVGTYVLSKHLLFLPLMIPVKTFGGLILGAAVWLDIKVEENKYVDKCVELIAEYKELQKQMKKG